MVFQEISQFLKETIAPAAIRPSPAAFILYELIDLEFDLRNHYSLRQDISDRFLFFLKGERKSLIGLGVSSWCNG